MADVPEWLSGLTRNQMGSARAVQGGASPQAKPWPLQFHSILVQTFQGEMALIDLWYDWPKGRNFNIIQEQLGSLTYDLEWTNGTSFVYDLEKETCRTVHVPVGILRPDWMDGAEYLGVEEVSGFKCNFWQKVDFITYWEDMETQRPVRWIFYTGRTIDVMTFEVGATLEDSKWQAPVYCFEDGKIIPPAPLLGNNTTEEERWLAGLQTGHQMI